MTDYPIDTIRRPLSVGQHVGRMDAPAGVGQQHRLHGQCPDGEPCVNRQTPCSQLCSRLQAEEIAEELRANAARMSGRSKQHKDAVLLDLRDAVHARAEDGRPIVVPDPGTDHGRALVKTLGAEIAPDTTPDIRPDKGDEMETLEETASTVDAEPPAVATCKINGCDKPAAATHGPYAKLCTGHAAEAKRSRSQVTRPKRTGRRRKRTVKPPPCGKERQLVAPLQDRGPRRPDQEVDRDRGSEREAARARDGIRGAGRRVREGEALT